MKYLMHFKQTYIYCQELRNPDSWLPACKIPIRKWTALASRVRPDIYYIRTQGRNTSIYYIPKNSILHISKVVWSKGALKGHIAAWCMLMDAESLYSWHNSII